MNTSPTSAASTTAKTRVLCVDDNVDLTSVLESMISADRAFECIGCLNSAWRLADDVCAFQPLPDVMILDTSMPGLDVFAVVRELVFRTPGLRIVIYSGHDDSVFKAQANAAGAFACVSKPDEPAKLLRAIHKAAAR